MSKQIFGYDAGTSHQIAYSNNGVTITRNAFLTLDQSSTSKKQLKRMKIPYVEINGELHLIGQDAIDYANILPNSTVKRPMAHGMLNPVETDAYPILRYIVKTTIGQADPGSIIYYSIPANPIDDDRQVDYHSDTLKEIIESLDYIAKPINEAVCLGMVGLEDNNFTGIAISAGAGMQNLSCMFKGMSAVEFSTSKSGDWIDEQVSADCGIPVAKAQKIKEKQDYSIDPNSSERRSREHQAIKTYYSSVIRYTLANFAHQFNSSENTPVFPDPVPIVIGGGSSLVPGYLELFKDNFTQEDFPVDISEIKLVDEPLVAIANGAYEMAKLEEEDE